MRYLTCWTVAGFLVLGTAGTAGPRAVIVGDDEPGEPLVVGGTVYATDGETPVEGATIYVYQTDRDGVYDRTGDEQHPYRIGGWMKTGADGRYELRTIRPGPYPRQRVPAHIHYVVSVPGGEEQRFELRFEGDPYLSSRQVDGDRAAGKFAAIRGVVEDADGTLRCERNIRLRE
jgi:protocatechuate 3,4-dioxygenase beta subunit